MAFCFDEAVSIYGNWIEGKLEEKTPIKEKGQVVGHRATWRLSQLLGTEKPLKVSVAAIETSFKGHVRRLD